MKLQTTFLILNLLLVASKFEMYSAYGSNGDAISIENESNWASWAKFSRFKAHIENREYNKARDELNGLRLDALKSTISILNQAEKRNDNLNKDITEIANIKQLIEARIIAAVAAAQSCACAIQ